MALTHGPWVSLSSLIVRKQLFPIVLVILSTVARALGCSTDAKPLSCRIRLVGLSESRALGGEHGLALQTLSFFAGKKARPRLR